MIKQLRNITCIWYTPYMYVFATHFNECTTNYIFVVHSVKWVAKTYSWQVFHRVAILSELNFPKVLTFFSNDWMTTLFPTALLQYTSWLFKPLFVWFDKKCIQCRLLFLIAVTHVWHLRAFSWQTWSGSRRQRRLQRIWFIVEKERSTVAVPTGSRSSLRTSTSTSTMHIYVRPKANI